MRKELARSFGATLVVLITIILTIVLIQTLGRASRGSISPQDVMLIMAYAALGRLPTILTLSLFIAMLSTLSRMYQDSEMVVWFASGRGLSAFLRPLLRFAWPVLGVDHSRCAAHLALDQSAKRRHETPLRPAR